MLQRNCRIEWIADRVRQPAIAFKAFGKFWGTLRMNE